MKGVRTIWTSEMLAVLRDKFPTVYNKELAKELGIGWRTIVRKARELGFKKEPDFLEMRRSEITEMAIKSRKPNPTKGLKGWSVPGGEKYRFKKGNISSNKNNPELTKKIHEARNETIRKEKLRLKYGLPQKTKLKLVDFY